MQNSLKYLFIKRNHEDAAIYELNFYKVRYTLIFDLKYEYYHDSEWCTVSSQVKGRLEKARCGSIEARLNNMNIAFQQYISFKEKYKQVHFYIKSERDNFNFWDL